MARGGQDVIGFTRIFVLFCTLVLVPALFMSGFGVIAILNEREAEKLRRYEDANQVIRAGERAFADALDSTDRAALARLYGASRAAAAGHVADLRTRGHPIGPWAILGSGEPVGESPFVIEGPAQQRLKDLARNAVRERVVHVPIDLENFSGVVSMQRLDGDDVFVYALDQIRLTQIIQQQAATEDMMPRLRVMSEGGAPVVNAVERLMSEVLDKAPETDIVSERRLEPPFDRFSLVVNAPPSRTSHATTIIYIVTLVVFLATLITGVVITARLIWHETRLSRLKTDFVSHVSHELRTPLTSIRMFIETLQLGRAQSAEEAQECLVLLAKETQRLSEMIERVLGYARLKAGRRPFNPTEVRVKEIVDEALDAFRAQNLAAQNLSLTTDVPDLLPTIKADREALIEALLNLVGNAYKYTGPHKEISVFARVVRNRVQLAVKDNGPGLPKAEHKRIFERFYQAQSLLSKKEQSGSGLGLAITRAIVEGNGGKIRVESEPGKGATFIIEMPVETRATTAAA
jgi:two-component system, OmpR family, phosphate regulon sensor histidine kinase PhoR